ncbi:hypothetical protein IFM89_026702 [Coptis chinensis]|uniref:RNase H type-1 domain-containing protein n=1 Tax=Coptis chinensis TaxID=261450 RepID=A0A835IXS8_9MAGN|nr:hypothetical protein IFM89_026702 [Coptis chinensis]
MVCEIPIRSAKAKSLCAWHARVTVRPLRLALAAAAAAFNTNKVHWQCKAAWEQARHKMEWLLISSTWRETNFSADSCARKGASLPKGVKQWWNSRADFISRIEDPNSTYFRFDS